MSSLPRLEVLARHRFPDGFKLDVEFQSDANVLALFGPSGAGKSTALAVIAGLLRPQQGRVRLNESVLLDTDERVSLPPRKRKLGIVLQDAWLFPHLNVEQNLRYGMVAHTSHELQDVAAWLEIAHLLSRKPRTLSGGERQRVALGRAVLSAPKLLALDEPFAAIDRARRDRLIEVVQRVQQRLDVPIILITHEETVVEALADEVVVLSEGRMESQAPTRA